MGVDKTENLLDQITFTAGDVQRTVAEYPLVFDPLKNDRVEWKIRFPPFLTAFYRYVLDHDSVPTQQMFVEYYIHLYRDRKEIDNLTEAERKALRARLSRTYPSLVRDLHFGLLLKEELLFCRVVYNPHLDVKEGVDLLLEFRDVKLGVNLFTETKRSLEGRAKKAFRREKPPAFPVVDIPVQLDKAERCGDFKLYGRREIGQLKKHLWAFLKSKSKDG